MASSTLTWQAPTTLVDGSSVPAGEVLTYNIYRGNRSDGADAVVINTSPINGLTYVDGTVQAGKIYYYTATAVRLAQSESQKSNVALLNLLPTKPPTTLAVHQP